MNFPPDILEELDLLLGGLIDEQLDAAGHRRLAQLLRSDAAVRDYYATFMAIHTELCWKHVAPPELEEIVPGSLLTPAEPPPAAEAPPLVTRAARQIEWRRHPVHYVLTVVVAVFAFWFVFGVWVYPRLRQMATSSPESTEDAPAGVAMPAKKLTVAQLTRLVDAVWRDADDLLHEGIFVRPGQRLELASGIAEITFDRGATVVLEGPARFVIAPADSMRLTGGGRLEQGRLTARVPPKAVGFTVQTEAVHVVDLGTEFGVAVTGGESADVVVFEGEVEAICQQGSGETVRLSSGRAIRVSDGRVQKLDATFDEMKLARSIVAAARPLQDGGFEESGAASERPGETSPIRNRPDGAGNSAWVARSIDAGAQVDVADHTYQFGVTPQAGSRFAVFTGDPRGGGTIAQSFDTIAGVEYVVSFYVARNTPNAKPTLEVDVFDGTIAASAVGRGDLVHRSVNIDHAARRWRREQVAFTAVSDASTLRFAEPATGNSRGVGPCLDSVTISAKAPVPLPESESSEP